MSADGSNENQNGKPFPIEKMKIKNEKLSSIASTKDLNSNRNQSKRRRNQESDFGSSFFDDVDLSDSSTFEESFSSKESNDSNTTTLTNGTSFATNDSFTSTEITNSFNNDSTPTNATNDSFTSTEMANSLIDISTGSRKNSKLTKRDHLSSFSTFSDVLNVLNETTKTFYGDSSFGSTTASTFSANSNEGSISNVVFDETETFNNETTASSDVRYDEVSVLDENTGLMLPKSSNSSNQISLSLIDEFLSDETPTHPVIKSEIQATTPIIKSEREFVFRSPSKYLDEFLNIELSDVKNVKRFGDFFDEIPSSKRQKFSPADLLSSLPRNVLVKIFNFVPTYDLLNNLVPVSKLFCQISKDPEIKISVKIGRGKIQN